MEDRLAALAAITTSCQTKFGIGPHLAGAFHAGLAWDLLWSLERNEEKRERESTSVVSAEETPCATPSWSWLSRSCPVSFEHRDDDRNTGSEVEVQAIDIEPVFPQGAKRCAQVCVLDRKVSLLTTDVRLEPEVPLEPTLSVSGAE